MSLSSRKGDGAATEERMRKLLRSVLFKRVGKGVDWFWCKICVMIVGR